jgi:F-type H+-transporting ATPase subunit b
MRWLSILALACLLSLGSARNARAADEAHGDHGHGAHLGEDVSKETMDPSEWKGDLAFFSLIVFLGLFGVLYAKAWPKISSALEEREAGIRRAIADAEKARIDSAEMLRQHQAKLDSVQEEVKAILAEARRDAERAKNDIVASANTEATAIKNRAIADIDRAKDQALHEVFGKMADQVAKATEQVVGRTVTGDDQNRFIREALSQVSPN